MWTWLLVFLGISIGGCAPSIRSRTAGSIGCPPSEIDISDRDTSLGWGSSSETWVASCRGKRFICSENTAVAGGQHSSGISQQVSCSEELAQESQPPAQSAAGTRSGSTEPSPSAKIGTDNGNKTEAAGDAPKSAAGFDFGLDVDGIKQACEGVGKSWSMRSEKYGLCSGTAADVGFDAAARVDFCDGRNCGVTLGYRPTTKWMATLLELKETLSRKYGEPSSSTYGGIPEDCRKEEQFVQCLNDGRVRLRYEWKWPSRQQIHLSVGRPETGDGEAAIRLKYTSQLKLNRVKANAL